jgi:hypothetical protein
MIKHNEKEVIVIHSYPNKSIVMDTKTTKISFVSNTELKTETKK